MYPVITKEEAKTITKAANMDTLRVFRLIANTAENGLTFVGDARLYKGQANILAELGYDIHFISDIRDGVGEYSISWN